MRKLVEEKLVLFCLQAIILVILPFELHKFVYFFLDVSLHLLSFIIFLHQNEELLQLIVFFNIFPSDQYFVYAIEKHSNHEAHGEHATKEADAAECSLKIS